MMDVDTDATGMDALGVNGTAWGGTPTSYRRARVCMGVRVRTVF